MLQNGVSPEGGGARFAQLFRATARRMPFTHEAREHNSRLECSVPLTSALAMPSVRVQPPASVHKLKLLAPPSKSVALRALVAASIHGRGDLLVPRPWPEDMLFMVGALAKLGVLFEELPAGLRVVRGVLAEEESAVLVDAGEGAAPARFLLALAAGLRRPVTVVGHGRLPQRPFGELVCALREMGAKVSGGPGLPLTVCGPVQTHRVSIRTDESSQFLSGLLLAAPLLRGLEVQLAPGTKLPGYVGLTRAVMADYGVAVMEPCRVETDARYTQCSFEVESDWSGAAFLLAAGAVLGCEVFVPGLKSASQQPDRAVIAHLEAMGCKFEEAEGGLGIQGPASRGLDADLSETPDLAPVLLPLAATVPLRSKFRGLARLQYKESDRLSGLMQLVAAHGATVDCEGEEVLIRGPEHPPAGRLVVETHGDHRMAMAGALLGLARPVEIDDAGCVSKSFPLFFSQWPGAACPNRGH